MQLLKWSRSALTDELSGAVRHALAAIRSGFDDHWLHMSHVSLHARRAAATTAAAGDIPPGFKELREGRARILLQTGNEVFYNEAQARGKHFSTVACNHRRSWTGV